MSGKFTFLTFSDSLINELVRDMRLSTAHNYRSCLNSFKKFLEFIRSENNSDGGSDVSSGDGSDDDGELFDPFGEDEELKIGDLNSSLLARYSSYLSGKDLSLGTQSSYMRILQAIYNKAVYRGLCEQKDSPFKFVYKGIPPTDNRSLTQEELDQINALDLSGRPKLEKARDFFFFSYACCGMPFVDLAYLTKKNISNGYIVYDRQKTKSHVKIKINAYMQMIIDRYSDPNSPYLFPILHSLYECERYKEYRRGINWYNRQLAKIALMLGDSVRLTSYTARHTWANLAYQRLHALAIISTCLGHSSERMTRIYLNSLNNKPCDDANDEMTKFLCEPLEKKGEEKGEEKKEKGKKGKKKTLESATEVKEEVKEVVKAEKVEVEQAKEEKSVMNVNKNIESTSKNVESVNMSIESTNMNVESANKEIESTDKTSNSNNTGKKNNGCKKAATKQGNKVKKTTTLLDKMRQNRRADECRFLCKKSSKSAANLKQNIKSSKFSGKK